MDLALKTSKEDGEEERPLFEKPTYLATAPSDMETDEDDDDDLGSSSFADNQYSNMNISSHLKNILSYDTGRRMDNRILDDDSDSDVESTSLATIGGIDLDQLNAEIDRNKFANFPLKPATEANDGNKKTKKTRNPREKKKRRDKGKKKVPIDEDATLEAEQTAKSKSFDRLLRRFAQDSESSEDEHIQDKKSKKKSSGRKTRKKVSNEIKLDENGEQMMRTTEILDATSSSSSEDERKLSKKQEMEMYRDAERQRRSVKVVLKPVYNYKSFDELAKRREEREQGLPYQDIIITHKAPQPYTPPRPPSSRPTFNFEVNGINDDSDSDIEITNDPKKIAAATQAAAFSPERSRLPVAISPVRHASTARRDHNRTMLYRMTNEGYNYRIKMEEAAKARGQYASATERARRLIEKEKNAMMINDQISRHFDKKKSHNANNDDDDEEDGDYEDQEGGGEDEDPLDDILNELSGSDEEEFFVQDAEEKPSQTQKRKNAPDSENNDVEEHEEDEEDMATMAFKRWKGKKVKKSTIFDDDDDDEDEQVSKKKKVTAKDIPAHSISNFFKAKEAKIAEEAPERDENKALSRLVRREDKEPVIDQQNDDDDVMEEAVMDIDKSAPAPVVAKKPVFAVPKGPREKFEYLEEEAEEEDDEFFGAAGSDGETGENLDEFEKDDLLVEDNNEQIDEAALREAYNIQDKETDSNMIQRLITDITSGNLRKQKAAIESGLMLDDVDLYDEEDNDLVAIRRAAAARRRKLLKKKGGDVLENMLSDPKTAAFAKAAQAVSDEITISVFSESEGEEESDEDKQQQDADIEGYEKSTPVAYTKRVIVEEDEDDEDEDQEMKDVSDDEDLLIVDEFDTMTSPMRGLGGGLASSIRITSADDEDAGFQIENMKSPINVHKAKSLYGSPGTLDRFKRLISETHNSLNGTSSDTGGPRVGFGSIQQKQQQKQQQNASEGNHKLTGSLGEMFTKPNGGGSKLKKLKSQTSNLFKYSK